MRFWLLLLLSFNVIANPLDAGDVKLGKQLVEKNCIACHAARFGGDGSKIYTREDHIIKTPKGLIQQVRNCNTNLGLKWFDDEELAAAAYLNQTYYQLK